jgi:hypothetical protein
VHRKERGCCINRSAGQSSTLLQFGQSGVPNVNWSKTKLHLDNAITITHYTNMPLIEEIQEDDAGPSRSGPSFGDVMRELAGRLALPEELLTSFIGGDICEYSVGSQS